MEKYKEGTVFELFENDNKEYVIIKKVAIEENFYLLVAPIYGKELNFNPREIIMLCVNKVTDKIEFEKDKEIIRKVIDNAFVI